MHKGMQHFAARSVAVWRRRSSLRLLGRSWNHNDNHDYFDHHSYDHDHYHNDKCSYNYEHEHGYQHYYNHHNRDEYICDHNSQRWQRLQW